MYARASSMIGAVLALALLGCGSKDEGPPERQVAAWLSRGTSVVSGATCVKVPERDRTYLCDAATVEKGRRYELRLGVYVGEDDESFVVRECSEIGPDQPDPLNILPEPCETVH